MSRQAPLQLHCDWRPPKTPTEEARWEGVVELLARAARRLATEHGSLLNPLSDTEDTHDAITRRTSAEHG
jgi:hypothetical protein